MFKYIYFPTGRQVWFDLAKSLYESGCAKPVVWVGDPRLDCQAEFFFQDCSVIDFTSVQSKISFFDLSFDIQSYQIFQRISTSTAREKTIKMMDRHDPYGAYRNIDRDVFFKNFLLYSISLIRRSSPDFLLMAESPHSPFQYVFYEVARAFDIKVFSFVSWSMAPLAFIREGIDGELINLDFPLHQKIQEKVFHKCNDFFELFSHFGSDIEPGYIKYQKKQDIKRAKPFSKVKGVYSLLSRMATGMVGNSTSLERGLLIGSRLDFLEPIVKRFLVKRNIKDLHGNMKRSIRIKSVPSTPYVYFPLHYEPERTTNPDGQDFHDQITSILALRSWLPDEIEIIVKEHYSQFSNVLQGYKGRSKYFYSLLQNIEGVSLACPSILSKELIEGAELTATITGTAALESALLGIPAIIFGNPWFKGVPGVWEYSDISDFFVFKTSLSSQSWGGEDIREWFYEKILVNSLFLVINPSNERYFKSFYEVDGSLKIESDLLFDNVRSLIFSKIKEEM